MLLKRAKCLIKCFRLAVAFTYSHICYDAIFVIYFVEYIAMRI